MFKKLLNKTTFLSCILCVNLTSCYVKEPIENYKGGIISEKETDKFGTWFLIKYKGKDNVYRFTSVYVTKADWNKYNINDTIK